jgi:hypothetical protein
MDMKNKDSEQPEPPRAYDDLALSPVAAGILWRLEREKRQTIADLVGGYGLRHWCRNTIKYHLRELLRAGLARKHGRGKATWYTL